MSTGVLLSGLCRASVMMMHEGEQGEVSKLNECICKANIKPP